MRRIVQFVFLLSYVTSIYGVTQVRIANAVADLLHAARSDDEILIEGDSRTSNHFPKFREAKPKSDVSTSSPQVDIAPLLDAQPIFHIPISFNSRRFTDRTHARAPPARPIAEF
jgi:hypothetical protein